MTSLLRSGLPFVGSGQKHAPSRSQVLPASQTEVEGEKVKGTLTHTTFDAAEQAPSLKGRGELQLC